ncbi:POU domain, class 4, transcription factor 3-like [Clavelina lepadiformis]|uniref:POU domain protein n=1 Tax=Clavelina lepadiformis TaxID=159417 RepID=A0ABP0FXJ3_CLALP
MFTNMLAPHPHHHRPPSPTSSMTSLTTSNYSSDQKYAPLHNAADAMRRMTSPVAYSGNLFAGFDETFFARAEALAAVDYTGKNQFKPEPSNHAYYAPSASHYGSQQHPAPPVPPPVYGSMHPPSAFHHTALQSTLDSSDVIDQLGSNHSALSPYQPPTFNSAMMSSSDSQSPYIAHPTPTYNHTSHFHPVSSAIHPSIPPPPGSAPVPTITGSPPPNIPNFPSSEYDTDPRELEAFAERFKQRRIKLGVTQNDVGQALANLKLSGVGSLSQSTICRFESLTLSHNNMVALKPILITWLEKAEEEYRRKMENAALGDKKRKRTSIAAPEKRSLEAYFSVQPRPSSEKIAAIAEKLDLKKNVVRVWFCNQRQKQKRMKFSAFNGEGM